MTSQIVAPHSVNPGAPASAPAPMLRQRVAPASGGAATTPLGLGQKQLASSQATTRKAALMRALSGKSGGAR